MKKIPSASVDLIVTDPPYNMKKSKEWDSYKEDEYIAFMGEAFLQCQRVLKDNGQMYFFHNDFIKMMDLTNWIRRNTCFVYADMIIFPKKDFRAKNWKYPGENNTLRSWFNICEYALRFINWNSTHTEWDKTGWQKVKLDVSNFSNLRKYAYEMLCYIGRALHTQQDALSKNSDTDERNTSSIANHAKRRVFSEIGGKTDHFTRYGSTQWDLCTEETYAEITEKYDLKKWDKYREYEDLRREYEDLRREYEDLRPVHNLDENHCNVWNVKWKNTSALHPCQKPTEIMERMVKCSSKPGAVVLDCFMGSGSTGVSCVRTGRDFIGIERDDKYYNTACERINNEQKKAAQEKEECFS